MDMDFKRQGSVKDDTKKFGSGTEGERDAQKSEQRVKSGLVGSVLKKEDSHFKGLRRSRRWSNHDSSIERDEDWTTAVVLSILKGEPNGQVIRTKGELSQIQSPKGHPV